MTPNSPDSDCVDSACAKFEFDWHKELGLDWDRYLNDVSAAVRSQLLHDLVAIDIEFRLRRGHPEPLGCETYFARYGNDFSVQQKTSLVLKEYRFRQLWNDCPEVSEFTDRFPAFRDAIELGVHEFLELLSPVTVSIFEQHKTILQMPLSGCLEIGRQRADEPPPLTVVDSNSNLCVPKQRLILVANNTSDVSRRHICVQAVANNKIRVSNLSNQTVAVELMGSIDPQSSRVFTLPMILDLNAPCAIRLSSGTPREPTNT